MTHTGADVANNVLKSIGLDRSDMLLATERIRDAVTASGGRV